MPEIPEMNGMNVRMNGKKRPRNTASGPHFSIMPSVLARRSGVIALDSAGFDDATAEEVADPVVALVADDRSAPDHRQQREQR